MRTARKLALVMVTFAILAVALALMRVQRASGVSELHNAQPDSSTAIDAPPQATRLQRDRKNAAPASFVIPRCLPRDCPDELLRLQKVLLALAEAELGPRGTAKPIEPPFFDADGPRIWHTPGRKAVRIKLSHNASGYWPTAIYEMAHEVVHLLDPVVGYTNCFEEGVAVEFSVRAQIALASPRLLMPEEGEYHDMLALVRGLPWGALPTARLLRETGSPLSAATPRSLREMDPTISTELSEALSAECVPR